MTPAIRESRTILGIDPGTNILGFGVVRIGSDGKPGYVDMGVLDLRRMSDPYRKLAVISDKVGALCDLHRPDDMAIESPFYGRNAQVIFKLGRAQGAAMVAALERNVSIHEYAPREAKMSICGNGAASKEQVAMMVEKTLGINIATDFLDATDALSLAMCHFYNLTSPLSGMKGAGSWKKFIAENPDRISKK